MFSETNATNLCNVLRLLQNYKSIRSLLLQKLKIPYLNIQKNNFGSF